MNQKNIFISVGILAVAVVLAFFILGGGSSISGDKAVATVNGEKITQAELQARFNQAKKTFASKGNKQFKGQAAVQMKKRLRDQLIGELLIYQKAKEQGFTASSSAVEKRYQQVVQQVGGEQALQDQLKKSNLTEEDLRENIRKQIITKKFIDSQAKGDVQITEQEMRDFYNKVYSQRKNAPSFEEAKSRIRTQLKRQKESKIVSNLISNLRKDADITTSTIQ